MTVLSRARALIRNLLRRRHVDRELDAELDSYVDLLADERRAAGSDDRSALRSARLALEGRAQVIDAVRQTRAGSGLDRLSLDVRSAIRGLARSRIYTAMSVLTLMLGIGATTVVFSVIDAALFKPLPYTDPDRLVEIETVFERGTDRERRQIGLTWRQLDEWRKESGLFAAIETYSAPQPLAIREGATGATYVGKISPGLTPMLGLRPLLGRGFTEDDIRIGARVTMLTERFWRAAFEADRAVVGRSMTIGGTPYIVVGVMPATLAWRVGGSRASAWIPFDERSEQATSEHPFVASIARVRPDLPLEEAERRLQQAADARHVGMPRDVELHRIADFRPAHLPGLELSFAGVGLLLLIACANVANLLLTRVLARGREIAVRVALGAGRARLVRLFLIEGAIVAVIGGALGLMGAAWSLRILAAVVPEDLGLFAANPLALDLRVLGFCAGAIVLTGILCSVLPALRAARTDVLRGLEGGSRTAGVLPAGRLLRLGLQTIQVAIALILLSAASLLTTNVVRLTTGERGYDVDLLGAVHLALPRAHYPDATSRDAFYANLMGRAQRIRNVRAAYGSSPAAGLWVRRVLPVDAAPMSSAEGAHVAETDITYASVVGLALAAGRWFGPADRADGRDAAVIDERFASRYWPGQSPLGRQFRVGPTARETDVVYTVVGVSRPVKGPADAFDYQAPRAYVFTSSDEPLAYNTLIIRSSDLPIALGDVQTLVRDINPDVGTSVEVIRDRYDDGLLSPRFYALVMTALAVLALLTASVGLYGVLSYSVRQRAREIAVRMALGASAREVRRMVIRDALIPVGAGAVAGYIVVFWQAGAMAALLHETAPHDPVSFAVAAGVLAAVAATASFVPALRASRLNPVATLRLD